MKEGDLLERLLAADVEGFNSLRGEHARVELFAAELAGLNLTGADLSSANLDKADLTGTNLTQANLTRASAVGADATGAKLVGVTGLKVRLTGAWLDGADLTDADLSRADLSDAILAGSTAVGARFAGARLKGVDAKGVRWSGADLSEAHLAKARFEGADLNAANLGGAVGPEADFRRARLDAISARDARFPEANFREASLVGAALAGANLTGADFSGADLTSADLSNANLTQAKLTGAKLRGATLADATLDGAALTGVDLSGVDLTGLDSDALGLSTEQVESLAAVGVVADASADVRIAGARVARVGNTVAILWENVERIEEIPSADPELEPPTRRRHGTVRVAMVPGRAGGESTVLPVSLDGVVSSTITATEGGFQKLLARQRPGGTASTLCTVSLDGRVTGTVTSPLGHDPLAHPLMLPFGTGLVVFSLARRGPALVLARRTDAGLAVVRTDNMPTAQGFAGRHHAVVACKGGVVVPAGGSGPGKPLRTPPGYPGTAASVVPVGDQWLAVWATGSVGREPAGVRVAWLVLRGAAETVVVSRATALRSLDAVGGAVPSIAWLDGDQPRVATGHDLEASHCGAPVAGAQEIALTLPTDGHPSAVVIIDDRGAAEVRELHGAVIGRWAPPTV